MANKGNIKGAKAEEAIRSVFRQQGYFVVRGVPYAFQGRDVTDIDLWLYGRTGAFRERINVDIKNKKTPQAIERFFWALGVKEVLRLDRCIVVTTERNASVVEFGRRSNVAVLDGQYLQDAQAKPDAQRVTEEDFLAAIRPNEAEELAKELQGRYQSAKARLLTQMTYDGCNLHLVDVRKCMDELMGYWGARESVRRVLYAILSYILVTIDYIATKMEFAELDRRRAAIENGLRYGNVGRYRLEEFTRILEACKNPDRDADNEVISRIVCTLRAEAGELRADMVAEYLSQQIAKGTLFDLGVQMEAHAFAKDCPSITDLPAESKSFVLMLADFCEMDRTKVMAC